MDERLKNAYLYDFYGELLNEHQREIYEDFAFHDLSLGEIAAEEGISRQAVQDMIRRCAAKLENYEKKLHLVEKFLSIKADVEQIQLLAEECRTASREELIPEIERISGHILEEL